EKLLFHSGTLSRKSYALRKIYPEPRLVMGARQAEKLDVREGDSVTVSTDRGSVDVPVSVDDTVRDERVFLSNNFEQKGVFSLLRYRLDPITKAPGIEGCEVRITKTQDRVQ
ncbi:MAG: hypothetical protein GTO08_03450, partial [Deltaproteobacteria bacterium]|nr:hypothetical protein [Deltaproteobacteria bacterium]